MPKRILVIDDDAQARSLVAAFLEPAGYEVRGAQGGVPGLLAADTDPPDVISSISRCPG